MISPCQVDVRPAGTHTQSRTPAVRRRSRTSELVQWVVHRSVGRSCRPGSDVTTDYYVIATYSSYCYDVSRRRRLTGVSHHDNLINQSMNLYSAEAQQPPYLAQQLCAYAPTRALRSSTSKLLPSSTYQPPVWLTLFLCICSHSLELIGSQHSFLWISINFLEAP